MRDRLIELLCFRFPVNLPNVMGGYDTIGERILSRVDRENLADHLIANGVTVQEWISVKDRLPETNYRVWVVACVDGHKSCVRLFERVTVRGKLVERFKYPWDTITDENITHWMPLPQPPKGE